MPFPGPCVHFIKLEDISGGGISFLEVSSAPGRGPGWWREADACLVLTVEQGHSRDSEQGPEGFC